MPWLTGEATVPLLHRYCLKANLWLAIFGFIGNYWYTHYFYNILKASYTLPSYDLNGVPFPMYMATHFYFTFYHTLSNMILRKVRSTFADGFHRTFYEVIVVLTLAYITAFMEAFTISGFPCYTFEDRHMAWYIIQVIFEQRSETPTLLYDSLLIVLLYLFISSSAFQGSWLGVLRVRPIA